MSNVSHGLNPYSIFRILFSTISRSPIDSRQILQSRAFHAPAAADRGPRGVSLWNVSTRALGRRSFIRNGSGSSRIIGSRRGRFVIPLPSCTACGGRFGERNRAYLRSSFYLPMETDRMPYYPLVCYRVQRFSTRHG